METPRDKAQHLHDRFLNEFYSINQKDFDKTKADIEGICKYYNPESANSQITERRSFWETVKIELKKLFNQP